MANTYTLIASYTVGSGGAATIDFTSIPATYTDLLVKYSLRTSTTAGATWYDVYLTFNGTTTNYSGRFVYGDGSDDASGTDATTAIFLRPSASTSTASTFGNGEVYIPNYTSSNNKSVSVDNVSENNATSAFAGLTASLWSNSAAITSITLTAATGTLVQYSTAYLYGIKNS
jgi:hypothetical protein